MAPRTITIDILALSDRLLALSEALDTIADEISLIPDAEERGENMAEPGAESPRPKKEIPMHTEVSASSPSVWTPPAIPDAERSIEDLCRERRVIEAKLALDLLVIDDDDETHRVGNAADHRQAEIEEQLAEREPQDPEEANMILRIVIEHLDGAGPAGREVDLLRAVSRGNTKRLIAAERERDQRREFQMPKYQFPDGK